MGSKSRTKGKVGEREVLNLLGDRLGQRFARNLQQSDQGGCDCMELDGIALEVKRAAKPALNNWWSQAEEQAIALGRTPVLAYRLDRQQWQFVIRLHDLVAEVPINDERATLSLEGFCQWYEAMQGFIVEAAA